MADTETVAVPSGSTVVEEWIGDGIRVLRCSTPDGRIIYYGQTSAGDILLPALIDGGNLLADNSGTVYRLDRSSGKLRISEGGDLLAEFELEETS